MANYKLQDFPERAQKVLVQAAQEQGISPDKLRIWATPEGDIELRNTDQDPGALESFAVGAAQGVLPTIAGLAAGAGAGALTGAATKNPAAIGAAGLAGGLTVGLGAGVAQQSLVNRFMPEIAKRIQLNREANPAISTAGEMASGFLVGGPGGLALTKEGLKKAAPRMMLGAGLTGGVEAGAELANEGEIDPKRVAIAAAGGSLQTKNTRLGESVSQVGERLGARIMGKAPIKILDPAQKLTAIEQIQKLWGEGQRDPAAYREIATRLGNSEASPAELKAYADAVITRQKKTSEMVSEERASDSEKLFRLLSAGASDEALPKAKWMQPLIEGYRSGLLRNPEVFKQIAAQPDVRQAVDKFKLDAPEVMAGQTAKDIAAKQSPEEAAKAKQKDYLKRRGELTAAMKTFEQEFTSARKANNIARSTAARRQMSAVADMLDDLRDEYLGAQIGDRPPPGERGLRDIKALLKKAESSEAEASKEVKAAKKTQEAAAAKQALEVVKPDEVDSVKVGPTEKPSHQAVLEKSLKEPGTPQKVNEAANAGAIVHKPADVTGYYSILSDGSTIEAATGAELQKLVGARQVVDNVQVTDSGLVFSNGDRIPTFKYSAENEQQALAVLAAAVKREEPKVQPKVAAPVAESIPVAAKPEAKGELAKAAPELEQPKVAAAKKKAAKKKLNVIRKVDSLPQGTEVDFTVDKNLPFDERGVIKEFNAESGHYVVNTSQGPVTLPKAYVKPRAGKPIPKAEVKPVVDVEAGLKTPDGLYKEGTTVEIARADGGSDVGKIEVVRDYTDPGTGKKKKIYQIRQEDGSVIQQEALAGNPMVRAKLDDPKILSSGIQPAIIRRAARYLAIPVDRLLMRPIAKVFEPVVDSLRKLGPEGNYLADKDLGLFQESNYLFNAPAAMYNEAFHGLTSAEIKRLANYMHDMRYDGASLIKLTPSEAAAYARIRDALTWQHAEQAINGPEIDGRGPKDDPNYIPSMASPEVVRVLRDGTSKSPDLKLRNQFNQLRDDWIAHYMQNGFTQNEAEQFFDDFVNESLYSQGSKPDSKFSAVRKAEGIGLPRSWLADIKDTLYWHAYRTAKDLAWYRNIESDPIAARIIGEVTDPMTFPDGTPVEGIAGKNAVKAWLLDVNASRNYSAGWVDDIAKMVSAIKLGPISAVRDFTATFGHLYELLPGYSPANLAKALNEVRKGASRQRMEHAGAGRTYRPHEWVTPDDIFGNMSRMTEVIRKYSGREKLEALARQTAFEVGRLTAKDMLKQGNMEFFRDLKLGDLGRMTDAQLIDATATKFIEMSQGYYRASGLPPVLTSHYVQPWVRTTFSLSRWPIERFNNWYKRVWRPLVDKGQVAPLVKSILGNAITGAATIALQQALFNRKPRSLTWSEWLRTNDETAYTLFAHLQTAGFAGILGDLMFAGLQVHNKEMPMGYTFLPLDMAESVTTRAYQAYNAAVTGDDWLGPIVGFLGAVAEDNVQAYNAIKNWKRGDTDQREEAIYRRQMGENTLGQSMKYMRDPLSPNTQFREADTIEKAGALAPALSRNIEATGVVPKLRNPVHQQQPNLLKPSQPEYYAWYGRLKGSPEEAAQQKARDMQDLRLTLQKTLLIQQAFLAAARRRAQVSSGPPG